jgi:hypothetical protein
MPSNRSTREQIGVDLPEPQQVEVEEQQVEEQAPERPEWLPENFNTPEEMAASYKEAQNKIREQGEAQRRVEMQLAQMQEMLEEDRDQRQQQFAQPQQDQNQLREQLMASYENDPIGTMAYLAQQYANQTVEARFQQLQQDSMPQARQSADQQNQLMAMTVDRALGDAYDDWGEYKEKVANEIQQDPSLLAPELLTSPEATMRQLSRIYENVKAREVLAQHQNGNFVSNELGSMKRQAQTLSGQGARPGEASADDEHFQRLMAAAKGMSYASFREG